MSQRWTPDQIRQWVEEQTGRNYWYQTIEICEDIATPGTVDSIERLRLMALPDCLRGKSVLDVGCNSGMIALECKKRDADRVVGIDVQRNRLEQARTLADIMELEVEFVEMDLFDAPELGQFDLVFCIAVLTEVKDLLGGLLTLKAVTRETLYLELATIGTFGRTFPILGKAVAVNAILYQNLEQVLIKLPFWRNHSVYHGTANLRNTAKGWALVPDSSFLNALMGDEFDIVDLGQSVRYRLLKLTRMPLECDPGNQA